MIIGAGITAAVTTVILQTINYSRCAVPIQRTSPSMPTGSPTLGHTKRK